MNSVKDFRGKIEPPVERGVLKIERYAERLTQGYSAHGGSYLWAPVETYSKLHSKSCDCLYELNPPSPIDHVHSRDQRPY